MRITGNTLDLVNDNGITIVDSGPGVTEHVEITDNTIIDPVTSGIFFGADGEQAGLTEGMVLRDVVIARNRISGFFASAGIIGQLPRVAENVRIVDNVVENTRPTDVRPGFHFVGGIILTQQSPAADPAVDFRLEGNAVVAAGPHAVLNLGGILLRTANRFTDLTVSANDVRCDGCPIDLRGDALAAGIWLWSGGFETVAVVGNRVVSANNALQLGGPATITDATVEGNEFLDSRNPALGQITIGPLEGHTVAARISGNRIADGAGYGIQCQPGGTFVLSGLPDNDFSNNAQGDISGCP